MRFQTGHLQNTFSQAKKNPKRKKRQAHKPMGWQVSDPLLSEENEEENMGCNPDKEGQVQQGNHAEAGGVD